MQAVRLTCLQCQQRKRKCDKQSPCAACAQHGLDCTAVKRKRLPRGSSSKRVNGDLDRRLARIESLLGTRAANTSLAGQAYDPASLRSDRSRWEHLTEEVAGIREIINHEVVFDGEEHARVLHQPRNTTIVDSTMGSSVSSGYLNRGHLTDTLVDIFEQRIDPILKVIHVPSLRKSLLDETWPHTVAQQAILSALQFSATCILGEAECWERLGAQKSSLCQELKRHTEAFLSEADLYTEPTLTSLQAYVIYLIGLRASMGWQAIWARIATAIRLAQLLGLDRSNSSSSMYIRETSRRVWLSICILDIQAALDGGFFLGSASNEPLGSCPLHINDSDLSLDSESEPSERQGFTDMTFPLMTYTMLRLLRRLIIVQVDEHGYPIVPQSWSERFSLVDECAQQLERNFLIHCDCTIDFQHFTRAVGDGMLKTMRLLARRPIHRFLATCPPPDQEISILELALDVLEQGRRKYSKPKLAIWRWFAWSKWYALAIVLAELCHYTSGPLYDRAWAITDIAFNAYKQSERPGPLLSAMERLKDQAHQRKMTDHNYDNDNGHIDSSEQASAQSEILDHTASLARMPETYSWISWDAFLVDATSSDYFDLGEQLPSY